MSKKPPVAQVRITPDLEARLDRLRDAIAPAELSHPAIYKAGLNVLERRFNRRESGELASPAQDERDADLLVKREMMAPSPQIDAEEAIEQAADEPIWIVDDADGDPCRLDGREMVQGERYAYQVASGEIWIVDEDDYVVRELD